MFNRKLVSYDDYWEKPFFASISLFCTSHSICTKISFFFLLLNGSNKNGQRWLSFFPQCSKDTWKSQNMVWIGQTRSKMKKSESLKPSESTFLWAWSFWCKNLLNFTLHNEIPIYWFINLCRNQYRNLYRNLCRNQYRNLCRNHCGICVEISVESV